MDHFNLDELDVDAHNFTYRSNDVLRQFVEMPFAAKFSKGKVNLTASLKLAQ